MARRKHKAALCKVVCKLVEPPYTEAYVRLPYSLVLDYTKGIADGFNWPDGTAIVGDILSDNEMIAAGFTRYAKFRISAMIG